MQITASDQEIFMEIIKFGKENNALVVKVNGRMDAVTAPEFEKTVGLWIEAG